MEIIDKLWAIEEIKLLKARYWRYIDTRDWAKFRDVFDPTITFEFPEFKEPLAADAFFAWVIDFLEGSISIHRGYAPEITIHDETHAEGIWQFEDRIYWDRNKPGKNGMVSLQGDGHYFDTYIKLDGKWKIAAQRLSRHQLNIGSSTVALTSSDRR